MRLTLTVGSLAARAPWWGFALLTLGIGVLRTGPLGIGPEWVGWLRSAGQTLPEPSQYLSSSVGPAAVMRLMGSPGDALWWGLGGVLWLGVFALPILVLSRSGLRGRLLAIGVAASPVFAVTLTMLGHYDLWIVAGSAVVALSRRWWHALVGSAVAVAGNPEQAVPSAIALLLVAAAWRDRQSVISAVVYVVTAMLGFVAAWAWVSASGSTGRSGAYLSLALPSIEAFLGVWPLAVYAWLGPLWIAVVLMLGALPNWGSRLLAAAGVVAIPGLMSITTLDGTRVFVAVGTGALVAMASMSLRGPWREWQPSPEFLGGAALGFVLMPSVIIDTAGGLRLPYADWLTQVQTRWGGA